MVRILVAEDDDATLEFMSRALTSEGHDVVGAQNGQDALERFQQDGGNFDILITDVEMPGLDGIELVNQAIGVRKGLKVLLISGFEDGMERAKGVTGATIKAINKPVTLEQLRAEVRALVG